MQYIFTKNDKKIPFDNIRKITGSDNAPVALEITFREKKLQEAGISDGELKIIVQDMEEMLEFTAFTEEGILLNVYFKYNKLDEISYKYNRWISNMNSDAGIISDDIETDNLIIVTLLKQSDVENKLDDTNETVNAMVLALAEMIGGN